MNVDGYAPLLTDYCLEVAPGQQVLVAVLVVAAPPPLALQREILERERLAAAPRFLPGQDEGFCSAARDVHLGGFATAELAEAEEIDASLRIQATENATPWRGGPGSALACGARSRPAA